MANCSQPRQSVAAVLRNLFRNPRQFLFRQWNWKAAFFSSLCRGGVFFAANLHAGLDAATGAMLAEFAYRAVTAGFYGSITQAFRYAWPRWAASITVLLALPLFSHTIEFLVHWLRGTPNLRTSIASSLIFTLISTLFNLHAMRRGILVVGQGGKSLADDLRILPHVIVSFVATGFGFAASAACDSRSRSAL
jgi:hypothetical protein